MSRTTRVRAKYSLYDKTAAADGVISMLDAQPFSDTSELVDDEQQIKKWMTLEGDGCILDGSFELLPADIAGEFMGVWSSNLSGADGTFATPPVLMVTFSKAHTSAGITLIFSESTGEWCNDLTIDWYGADGGLLATADFKPNAAVYFCSKQVEDYYKVKVTFQKTNQPEHFLKLTGIRYGVLMELGEKQLITCRVLEEVDPVSSKVSINTLDLSFRTDSGEFDLLNLTGAYVLFQQRQEVNVNGYIDGIKMDMGTFYLDTVRAENTVSISCIDLLGVLDDTEYLGGYWPDGITAGVLISDILHTAGLEDNQYAVDDGLSDLIVRGYLPICTHREALQQVAYAIGAAVDCSRSAQIQIRRLGQNNPKVIPLSRKVTGHKQQQEALVTGVEIYTHNYALGNNTGEVFKELRQPGDYIIKFSRPAANLSITGAAITESGINYAKIHVTSAGTVTITGRTYEDSTELAGSVYADSLPANAKVNIKTLDGCTLDCDAQALAQRIYDYYQRRVENSGDVILLDEKAGDWLTVSNKHGKALTGTAEQIDIDLTGGFIAKVVTRG